FWADLSHLRRPGPRAVEVHESGRKGRSHSSSISALLPIGRRDVLVRSGSERLIGDVRMRLDLVPELSLDRRDVESDPTVVLPRIPSGRGLEVAAGRRRTVEHDVVLLPWIPPQVVERRDFQELVLTEPSILGGGVMRGAPT